MSSTVTVQPHLCVTLTSTSIISHYLARNASKTVSSCSQSPTHRWRNQGGRIGLGSPTFISGGPGPPTFLPKYRKFK